MFDWKKEIGIAFLVKQRLFEVDSEGLWPFHYPEVAATETELFEAEREIGQKLDVQHRAFLKSADGWKSSFQCTHLLGTKDYQGSERLFRANELLGYVESNSFMETCDIERAECYPIGVSTETIDVFVVVNEKSEHAGSVLWIAGQLIERFGNFEEFFLATVDYNRHGIESLQKGREIIKSIHSHSMCVISEHEFESRSNYR